KRPTAPAIMLSPTMRILVAAGSPACAGRDGRSAEPAAAARPWSQVRREIPLQVTREPGGRGRVGEAMTVTATCVVPGQAPFRKKGVHGALLGSWRACI